MSRPPVRRSASISATATGRRAALQISISGRAARIGPKNFSSFWRIQLARRDIGELATAPARCKAPRWLNELLRLTGAARRIAIAPRAGKETRTPTKENYG